MKSNHKKQKIVVVLHDIRSVHNAGSVFRTSDAVGVEKIYLTGYTPAPLDRFGNKRSDFQKVALGSLETSKWEKVEITDLIATLKEDGYFVVGVEQSKTSVDYREIPSHSKIAFIFGNEVDGIGEEVLLMCDAISEIEMLGTKESLNVSVTVGIILFEYRDTVRR